MKKILKGAGGLLLDQFIGVVSAFMLVLCVAQFFGNSLSGYTLAFCVCFGFYAYTTYVTAFKCGFRDSHRIQKDSSYRAFMYKGAIIGGLASVPLLIVTLIYFFITKAAYLAFFFMNMYWFWPLGNIFPNHRPELMILAYIPMILIPWIAYIAGYKNFMISDIILKKIKSMSVIKTQERK